VRHILLWGGRPKPPAWGNIIGAPPPSRGVYPPALPLLFFPPKGPQLGLPPPNVGGPTNWGAPPGVWAAGAPPKRTPRGGFQPGGAALRGPHPNGSPRTSLFVGAPFPRFWPPPPRFRAQPRRPVFWGPPGSSTRYVGRKYSPFGPRGPRGLRGRGPPGPPAFLIPGGVRAPNSPLWGPPGPLFSQRPPGAVNGPPLAPPPGVFRTGKERPPGFLAGAPPRLGGGIWAGPPQGKFLPLPFRLGNPAAQRV